MHDDVGEKFQRDLTFQLFIARQPHDAHSAASKNFDQRVTAEKFLPAPILTERRLRHVARALVNHIPGIQCGFSSQSFWKRGSFRSESNMGSSRRSAGVSGSKITRS